jgi:Zn ribbon nucleic-acid-binding protein
MTMSNDDKEEKDVMCPKCEKEQEHVKMVETKGELLECPKCHYLHMMRRA